MTILIRIQTELKDAMRAQDKKKVGTLRLITAAVKQIEVDERVVVDDTRLLQVLDKLAKQRKESITQFQAAKRDDLVAQEEYELSVIGSYLPAPLSDTEVDQLITQALNESDAKVMADMGKVMVWLKPHLQGRCDMGKVSALIKARLL